MRRIILKAIYALRAVEVIRRPKLGDVVSYGDRSLKLVNGPASPFWKCKNDSGAIMHVHENDFKISASFSRLLFSFNSTYSFFMQMWLMIHERNKTPFSEVRKLTKSVAH